MIGALFDFALCEKLSCNKFAFHSVGEILKSYSISRIYIYMRFGSSWTSVSELMLVKLLLLAYDCLWNEKVREMSICRVHCFFCLEYSFIQIEDIFHR